MCEPTGPAVTVYYGCVEDLPRIRGLLRIQSHENSLVVRNHVAVGNEIDLIESLRGVRIVLRQESVEEARGFGNPRRRRARMRFIVANSNNRTDE